MSSTTRPNVLYSIHNPEQWSAIMTITKEQLQEAAENAAKLKRLRDANTLTDFLRSIKKYGSLTQRQEAYAQLLVDKNSNKALKELAEADAEWRNEWNNSPELQKKAEVIASYYATTQYYNNDARGGLVALGKLDGHWTLPAKRRLLGMINNKYAANVWKSHSSEAKWKVGDMVAIRKTYKGQLAMGSNIETRAYLANRTDKPMYDELTYMVVQADSKPIDQSYSYDPKRGGCRYYKLLPVGVPTAVHVMECNLKKVLKRKVTK